LTSLHRIADILVLKRNLIEKTITNIRTDFLCSISCNRSSAGPSGGV
jgi:hypothetical protein